MGNTCKPMADSFHCMTKPTTIKKKKKNAKWLGADYGGRTLKHEPRLEVALKASGPLKPFEMRVGDSV